MEQSQPIQATDDDLEIVEDSESDEGGESCEVREVGRTIAGTGDVLAMLGGSRKQQAKISRTIQAEGPVVAARAQRGEDKDSLKASEVPKANSEAKLGKGDGGGGKTDEKVTGTDFKKLFMPNPKWSSAGDADGKEGSHLCSKCSRPVAITVAGRNQWANAKDHIRANHSQVYNQVLLSKKDSASKQAREMENEETEAKRQQVLEKRASLAVSATMFSLDNYLSSDNGDEGRPMFDLKLTKAQEKTLQLGLAYWVAKDGLSQNTFEKEGFKSFAALHGWKVRPVSETVRKAQAFLAQQRLKKVTQDLALVINFSPLQIVSCQTDVWSAHDGCQQMGVRLTYTHPVTLEPVNIILPLEAAKPGSLDAKAEADLVYVALQRVLVSPVNIYSQTTDTASVALLSTAENDITSVTCKAHITALVLKDCVKLPDSRDLDLEQDLPTSDAVGKVFVGVATRAAHFHRSALAERGLTEYQVANNKKTLRYKQWSPTRWTGAYEALLRDIAINRNGGKEFVHEYIKGKKENDLSAKVRSRLTLGMQGEDPLLVLSIMKPLYDLTVALQADDISLAEAHILILETADKLYSPLIQKVDEKGDLLKRTNERGEQIPDTFDLTNFNESFQGFVEKMQAAVQRRLVDEVEDETVISLILDPRCYDDLVFIAGDDSTEQDSGGDYIAQGFHQNITEKAKSILGRMTFVEMTVKHRMRRVLRSRNFNDEAKTEGDPGTAEQGSTANLDSSTASEAVDTKDVHESVPLGDQQARKRISTTGKVATRKQRRAAGSSGETVTLITLEDNFAKLADAEFDSYKLARRTASHQSGVEFWAENATRFSALYHVFLGNRSARPASARLESAFSMANSLVPHQRRSMSMETLNNLLLLKASKFTPKDLMLAAQQWIEDRSQ